MKRNLALTTGFLMTGFFLVLLYTFSTSVTTAEVRNISAKEAFRLVNKNKGNTDFVVIDLRTPGEFNQGHIENAVNINYFSSDFKSKLQNLDKDKTYLFHCKSGGRSGKSIAIFDELKFKNILHMSGGFDEWLAGNIPFAQ
ncbi:MAG: rhodanese-like domain-containing protein [Nitrospinota bacterium]